MTELNHRHLLDVSGCGFQQANGLYFPQGTRNEQVTFENRNGCVLSLEVGTKKVAWVLGYPTTTTKHDTLYEPIYALRPGLTPAMSTCSPSDWQCNGLKPPPLHISILSVQCPSLLRLISINTSNIEEQDVTSHPIDFLLIIKGHALRLIQGGWLTEAIDALDIVIAQAASLSSFATTTSPLPAADEPTIDNGVENIARITRECRVARIEALLALGLRNDASRDLALLQGENDDLRVATILGQLFPQNEASLRPIPTTSTAATSSHIPTPRVTSQLEKGGVTLTTQAGEHVNFHVDGKDANILLCNIVAQLPNTNNDTNKPSRYRLSPWRGNGSSSSPTTIIKIPKRSLQVIIRTNTPHEFLLELHCTEDTSRHDFVLDLTDLGTLERTRCVKMFEDWVGGG